MPDPGWKASKAPTPVPAATLLVLAILTAGCSGEPAKLPGVHTATSITDQFRCGGLLGPDGCPIVRFPTTWSGCKPEVPGYAECDILVNWTATSGAAVEGSRLVVSINGTDGPSCAAEPPMGCSLAGNQTFRHSFSAPDQTQGWTLGVRARLESSGGPPATGEFTLTLTADFRTDPA